MTIPSGGVRYGVDQLIDQGPHDAGRGRVGLITNDAATTAGDGRPSRVALQEAGFNLVRLFSPEHGLAATAADGEAVGDARDGLTGLPVTSLYGKTRRPPAERLAELDLLLYDIPEVGARFYTYIWTLSHAMEACAEAGKPIWVLDRPNPIGGDLEVSEGPILDESTQSSFVGRWAIPVRYSMTIGELAAMWNEWKGIGADLRIVQCEGWRRGQHWPELGLPFVPPSPAMRDYETALLYPGTCLFEGTNLSEGRGTAAPFRQAGAPWMDGRAWSDVFNALGLPGVRAQAVTFVPDSRKHGGERCGGVRLEVSDTRAIRPVATGLHLVGLAHRLHPEQFQWDPYPTAANPGGGGHFDRLIGRPEIRPQIEQDPPDLAHRIAAWTDPNDWVDQSRAFLLYDG
jgi:uncharacterized protein YbbC (DUF1343 family)